MNKIFYIKIILLLLSLTLYPQKYPREINKLIKKYSKENNYMYSVGIGTNKLSSQIDAYINMASKFNTGYAFNSVYLQFYILRNVHNVGYFDFIYNNPQLMDYVELFNIEFIKDVYVKKELTYYSFACLDKNKLIFFLKNRIFENEDYITLYMQNLPNDALKKFAVLDIVSILSKKNEIYSRQLSILGENVNLNYKYSECFKLANDALKNLTFNISTENITKNLSEYMFSAIKQYDFTISQKPYYTFKLDLDMSDVRKSLGDGYNYFYNFRILLYDNKNNVVNVFNFKDNSGKEFAFNKEEAKRFIMEKIEKKVQKEFNNIFYTFLYQYII